MASICLGLNGLKHWKARVVMMSTLPSLMAPDVVIMTTSGAISYGKVGIIMIMTTLRFEWVIWWKLSDVSSAFCVHTPCRFKWELCVRRWRNSPRWRDIDVASHPTARVNSTGSENVKIEEGPRNGYTATLVGRGRLWPQSKSGR